MHKSRNDFQGNPPPRWTAGPVDHSVKFEYDNRSTREAFPGSIPLPKTTPHVHTGMPASPCVISPFITVGHHSQLRSMFQVRNKTKVAAHPAVLSTYSSVSWSVDVRTARPYHEGLVLTLSAYGNSLATLKICDGICKKGHGGPGVSLRPIKDSISLTTEKLQGRWVDVSFTLYHHQPSRLIRESFSSPMSKVANLLQGLKFVAAVPVTPGQARAPTSAISGMRVVITLQYTSKVSMESEARGLTNFTSLLSSASSYSRIFTSFVLRC